MTTVQKRPFSLQNLNPRALAAVGILTLGLASSTGCRAQNSTDLSPELARTMAVTIRSRANLPFTMDIKVTDRRTSEFPGWDRVTAIFWQPGSPQQTMNFLLSKDGKQMAQFNAFDISKDPRTAISDDGRPARGGGEDAPVHIIVYDDLQCPYCARMHQALFPAVLERYGDKVHIVYKDFPLNSIHPWAKHAAVDAHCLSEQSGPAYWSLIDTIHADHSAVGKDTLAQTAQSKPDTPEAALQRSIKDLDRMTLDQATKAHVDLTKLNACIAKQDATAVNVTEKEADSMGLDGAPILYINGLKIPGAVPVPYVWKAIDEALTAKGITPPPAVPLPDPGQ